MKYERIVTLDFETYFSKEYSLKSKVYNTSEYVRDEQFKAQCVGIKINNEPVAWYRDEHVETAIKSIDWSTSALLCHHTAFDGLILSHHYGLVPAYFLDTLSMARALHSNSIGASLDEVARYYKVGNKLPDILGKTKGIRDLPDELMIPLGQYCALDVELCYLIFTKMRDRIPESEMDLIDLTIRLFCDPILSIDIPRVEKALKLEQSIRRRKVLVSGVPLETLSSSPKFAQALEDLNVEPPTKISPRTGKDTYAFSKTDLDFIALGNHPDKRIRRLVAGRLAAKSTIGESRAERFISVGKDGKKLPVYLSYYGAHTGRWSGGNKMNLQNLKRGGELRKSIMAPEGHAIVVADSAQIEARVNAWFAGDSELLSLFRTGADVYKHMASEIYRIPVEEVDKTQRFVGKVAVLGLGYGMGWAKFQHTLAAGAMGPPVDLDDGECAHIVRMYRNSRLPIAKLWRAMENVLYSMVMKKQGERHPVRWDDENRIWLPNGLFLQYPFLSAEGDETQLSNYKYYDYDTGVKRSFGVKIDDSKAIRIYGGLLTENIVQALARIIVAEQMLIIADTLKQRSAGDGRIRRVVTTTHDEIVVCVPEEEAQETLDMMLKEMSTPPSWCSDLPLSADGGFDRIYSK